MPTAKKLLLWNYHIVCIERDLFGKPFESAGQENYVLCVYSEFSSELVLSFLCMTGSQRRSSC